MRGILSETRGHFESANRAGRKLQDHHAAMTPPEGGTNRAASSIGIVYQIPFGFRAWRRVPSTLFYNRRRKAAIFNR
jgi:hypothetical protein